MSRDGKRRRGLSYEDRVLWTHVTKAIKPLRAKPLVPPDEDPAADDSKSAPKPPAKRAAQSKKVSHLAAAPAPQKPPAPQPTTLGRRMKQRVARGKEAIDARLDLHGFTQSEAHSALLHFLRNAHSRDARLVLVITGKGSKNLGRSGEIGVLRRQVPQWLGLPEFRELVVGFEDASIRHGGEGALYVRVRRAARG
jgi:DNA-nicking Smr family endonuclease